ncbi:MGH1-like glycoside hydrolase domain-containing protein [Nonomuraea basaltis]|uniref:MGH1-like glycoside hydrolase domain-containing protein n=1 Tax=Nonomuraea basaltis TaxID=2495887 RepID=UPI00110C6CA6|nr:glucosidase [Nonomuraea basaltis]TMS00016.1 glucosidase [Nonomuraea basaltis]
MDAERERLRQSAAPDAPWRRWGPYLSERQWGTVREDYSHDGDAWNHFPHDHARSRAYRWGEDGLGGVSDDKQRLCLSVALWNGKDPILKERPFGLTNGEGNHGEDVKEYYFYLDSTPTHSYMRFLYKYPQGPFPYDDLVATNAARDRRAFEYELLDTGVFDGDRYFDVFVEYAKAAPDDLLVLVTVANRGPDEATIHVLPTLWFRNTWSPGTAPKPVMREAQGMIETEHQDLGTYRLYCGADAPLLFTENETNNERLFGTPNATPFVKDGIGRHVVDGDAGAVNPDRTGTKAAAHHTLTVPAGGEATVRVRLSATDAPDPLGDGFDEVMRERRREADDFYAGLTPESASADEALVLRQALAGLLWSKQYYFFDVETWLAEHGADPWTRTAPRNHGWFDLDADDVLLMPDKWEYPWFAAWDLAFHAVALAPVDLELAKHQVEVLLGDRYLHANGQVPAYEWGFGDVNPPVHAWAARFITSMERRLTGRSDLDFLERVFQKLLVNYTWWVNRKDTDDNNVFQGGFLGLDNIGVFDRSAPLPTGGTLDQADGTAWMAFYAQTMLQMAAELSDRAPAYEDLAVRFAQHFLRISASIDRVGDVKDEVWDEGDGFFYDVLRLPYGDAARVRVRSMVGLLPLCASTVFSPRAEHARLFDRIGEFARRHPALAEGMSAADRPGVAGRRLLSLLDDGKLERVLTRMLDEREFLSPYGIRSLSRFHAEHPYELRVDGEAYRVAYLPAESDSGMFGGNSNWRGPVWFPVNALIVRALLHLYAFYGDDFTVECPAWSGNRLTLYEVSKEISDRLVRIFLRGPDGRRPVYGGQRTFQEDPHWRDLIQFHEYFHGDDGAGLGAAHQTGWTALVAAFMIMYGRLSADDFLTGDRMEEFG